MRLSDALRFSRSRRAQHPGEDGMPITGTDFGIECVSVHQLIRIVISKSPDEVDGETMGWSEMPPALRRRLLQSEEWTPLDEKPAMLVLAEAAADWTATEPEEELDNAPEDEEGYYA